MKYIDELLNSYTMYRVVLYGLGILAIVAIIFGATGILFYSPLQLIISLIIICATCYVFNTLFAKMLQAPTNSESYLITALILFFILTPVATINNGLTIVLAGVLAMGSKYVLALGRKHIFNPAAIATVLLGLLGNGGSIWWVASDVLLPVVAIIGFLIVRKTRRYHLVGSFLLTALLSVVIQGVLINKSEVSIVLTQAFMSFPLIFLATVMLTEPLTTPPTKRLQMIYGAIVGVFFGAQFSVGPFYSSPGLALVLGNIYSYIVSPKQRLYLALKEARDLASGMHEYIFTSPQKLAYQPGQYLEWTLPHKKVDGRGNRRYFTVASSPTEEDIKLGVRVQPEHGSSFKNALVNLKTGGIVAASQLAGDFTMPTDVNKKLLFIAGGIGITPFRSMLQYLSDKNEKRDIVLIYTAPIESEFAYKDVFDYAIRTIGAKIVYVITRPENAPQGWTGKTGRISEDMLKEVVPDYKERTAYLSGPNAMVRTYKALLHQSGISGNNIKTDYFPGF